MYFWEDIFTTTDIIITNEFFSRSHHVHHRKNRLQKESPVQQNIVSLSQKKHFCCKRLVHDKVHFFPASTTFTGRSLGERNHIIYTWCLGFCFVLFFSPLICHQGPKISEKLECTQLNKQTNLLKHFSGAHKLRLVCLFPNKHHSWSYKRSIFFNSLQWVFVHRKQTGNRFAARIFQRRKVGWRSQCFTPTRDPRPVVMPTPIHWFTKRDLTVFRLSSQRGCEGEGQPYYKITASFRCVTRRGAPNRLSM